MPDIAKLEEQRKNMVGNWGNRHFTNMLEVMYENAKNFDYGDHIIPDCEDLHRKYEIVDMIGRAMRLAILFNMDEKEIFSMYQALAWEKGRKHGRRRTRS
jgi:hypothetical protein